MQRLQEDRHFAASKLCSKKSDTSRKIQTDSRGSVSDSDDTLCRVITETKVKEKKKTQGKIDVSKAGKEEIDVSKAGNKEIDVSKAGKEKVNVSKAGKEKQKVIKERLM